MSEKTNLEALNVEVLYLYIKEYKTLKDIQVNFSGKYTIELIDNLINVDENENFPSSVFPISMYNKPQECNQINNVSAIIGENGAGKSLLLECLIKVMTNDFHNEEEFIVGLNINNKVEFFHSLKETLDCKHPITDGLETRSLIERHHEKEKKTIKNLYINQFENTKVIYYSPIADLQTIPYRISDPKYNDISTNYLLEFDKANNEHLIKENSDKLLSHKFKSTERFINLFYSELSYPNEIQNFIPKHTYLKLNKIKDPEDNERKLKPNDDIFLKKFFETYNSEVSVAKKITVKIELEFCFSIINLVFHEKKKDFNLPAIEIIFDESGRSNLPIQAATKELIKKQQVISKENLSLLFDTVIELIKKSSHVYEEADDYYLRIDDKIDLITILSNYQSLQNQLNYSKDVLLDFHWRKLSSGEKAMLDIFARFYDTLKVNFVNQGSIYRGNQIIEDKKHSNLFILIDEGEMGFHPQWQKNYLKYLIDFFQIAYNNFNIQIFLTSHSPFLVSDLPKGNITFLEVVDGKTKINEDINNTFGGNIHELFSKSFFLKDGIIGAFAQEIINNKVIEELISNEKMDVTELNELQKIIDLIGESIVRNKLNNMLRNKKILQK